MTVANTLAAKTFKIGGDMEVNRLGFGAMRITGQGIWGPPKDPAESKRVLKRAVELGVNFIDTADSYGPAVSEPLIGEALAPFPKTLVVATKGGLTRQGPDLWAPVGRPEYLEQQVHMSLRWLKTGTIDLWQLHRIDPKVPVEESLEPIVKLQKQGKIRHVGLSEVKPAEIDRARGNQDRQRAEHVQRRRPPARGCAGILREKQPGVHSLVPGGVGQAGATRWKAGRTR
jgi:pyridoxine 4-dehydrogenase